MTQTLHCPLCGLYFHYASELDLHAREDHAPPPHLHRPAPHPRTEDKSESDGAGHGRSKAIR